MNLNLFLFKDDLAIYFLIRGSILLLTAVAILVQPRKESKLEVVKILWLFVGYVFTHALVDFIDMWLVFEGNSRLLYITGQLMNYVYYSFLFEFGRRLLGFTRKSINKWSWFIIMPGILITSVLSNDFWVKANILMGYFICLPAGVMVGLGSIFYYIRQKSSFEPLKIKKYFYWFGFSFLAWAFFYGLIRVKSDFFLASWLNHDSFLLWTKIPVQLFRTFCAIISAWAVIKLLKIFNWESTNQLRDILKQREKITEGIQEGIMLLDKDFNILWVNQSIKDRHGDNVVGGKCYRVTRKKEAPCETSHDTCPLVEAAKEKQPEHLIYACFDKNKKPKYIEVNVYPIMDEKGQITEFVHISRNVTERQQKEEELKIAYMRLNDAQIALIDSEKLAAIGVLACGVAHEVRNPLAIVLQGINFLEDQLKSSPQNISEILNLMKENIKRGDKIVNELLSFSRKTEFALQEEEINIIIENSLVLVQHKIKLDHIEVNKSFGTDLPKIFIDRQKIEQALVNILLNAIQAVPVGGKIFIRSYLKTFDEIKNEVGRRKSDLFKLGEQALVVEVEDTGKGISKNNMNKLFTPFFTTKGPGGGIGLGLSVTRNIMLMHKGSIEIISQENKSTKVVLTFKMTPGLI